MAERIYRGPTSVRSVFSNTDTHPLLLDLALIRTFKSKYISWEPETIWAEIAKTFGTAISEVNKAKVHAIRTCHMVDRPYEAWEVFEKTAIAFNNGIPLFDVMQQPSPQACAFTVDALRQIRTKQLSDEVEKYIAAVMLDNGIVYAPEPIEFANKYMGRLLFDAGKEAATKVAAGLRAGRVPHVDSTNIADIQLWKSKSVVDYVGLMEKRLYTQLKHVFRETK